MRLDLQLFGGRGSSGGNAKGKAETKANKKASEKKATEKKITEKEPTLDKSGKAVSSFHVTDSGNFSIVRSDGTKDRIANNIGNMVLDGKNSHTEYERSTKDNRSGKVTVVRMVGDYYGSGKKNMYRVTSEFVKDAGTGTYLVSVRELPSKGKKKK